MPVNHDAEPKPKGKKTIFLDLCESCAFSINGVSILMASVKATPFMFLWSCSIILILFWMGGMNMNALENKNKNEEKKNIFIMTDGSETRITVKTLGEFFIKIKSNPTTGYGWSLQKITDEAVIKFRSKGIEEDDEIKSKPPLLGAPTFEIFIFEPLKSGEIVVYLKYHRLWEKDVPPIKIHKIYITIKLLE